jgi:hypothetical protein
METPGTLIFLKTNHHKNEHYFQGLAKIFCEKILISESIFILDLEEIN